MLQVESEREWFGEDMKIKEVMSRMPRTVAADRPIQYARMLMRELGVRHLPVINRGELVGILSERDLRTAEVFHGTRYLTAGDAMTAVPYAVSPEAPLSEVLHTMIELKIGSTVVTSPSGVVIGIFTASDAMAILQGLVQLGARDDWKSDLEQAKAA